MSFYIKYNEAAISKTTEPEVDCGEAYPSVLTDLEDAKKSLLDYWQGELQDATAYFLLAQTNIDKIKAMREDDIK